MKKEVQFFCRLTPINKEFIHAMAKINDCTVTAYINHLIDNARLSWTPGQSSLTDVQSAMDAVIERLRRYQLERCRDQDK
jgi:hypothetical protein